MVKKTSPPKSSSLVSPERDSPFASDDVTLYCSENGHDKYYRVTLKSTASKPDAPMKFRPSCSYGPRNGTALESDFFKPEWVKETLQEAREEAIKILLAKIKRGYTTHFDGSSEKSAADRAMIESWKLMRKQSVKSVSQSVPQKRAQVQMVSPRRQTL